MPATAEPPVKITPEPMVPLDQAFKNAMTDLSTKGGDGAFPKTEPEAEKKPVKTEPAKTEPAKAADAKKEEPAKAEPTKETKKKSALDAALSDDPATETKTEPVDEVQKLVESADPNWEKARETMKRQSEEVKTLREQVKKSGELPPEVAAKVKATEEKAAKLEAENAKLRDSIVALDVRYEPGFQEKFVQGRNKLVAQTAAKVEAAGGNKQAFIDAMELSGPKRSAALREALDGVEPGYELNGISARLGQIDVLDEERDERLADPHQTFEQLKQQREIAQKEHEEQVSRFKEATFEKTRKALPKLSKFMRPAPEDAEGAADYNAGLQADLDKAPQLLDVAPEDAALLAFKAARFDSVEKIATERFARDSARIAELEATIAKYEGAEPGFRGGGKPVKKEDYEQPIEEVFTKALRGQEPLP